MKKSTLDGAYRASTRKEGEIKSKLIGLYNSIKPVATINRKYSEPATQPTARTITRYVYEVTYKVERLSSITKRRNKRL